jgi:hypothetical protein
MQIRRDGWSIVVVGAWNPRIFTVDWLSANVFRVPEVQVEVPTNPGFPYRFTGRGVQLVPSSTRLAFSPLAFNDDTLTELERQCVAVLEALPHTPLGAVGTNLGYVQEHPPGDLLRHFELSDLAEIATAGYTVLTTEINRRLGFDGGSMNFKLSLVTNRVLADFNFHREAASCQQAAAMLRGSILSDVNRARTFLQQAYASNLTAEVAER